jgi:CRISPR/Cas system endoribonuclease Cas6 (RAMP superfamily)
VEEWLEMRFLTPTQLKYEGRPAPEPEFHILWRNLQRRLSLLRLAHGAGRPEIDFAAGIRRAETIHLVHWSAREVNWQRYSRRQGQRVPMGGFVGAARYEGDLVPFLPVLKLGSLVGVGDNCTFGMGQYEILSAIHCGGMNCRS